MIFMMVLVSTLLNDKEIIFPEISALVIGAWFSSKQPWMVSKTRFFLIMSIGSFLGICIVKYLPFDTIYQIMIGLICAFSLLIVFKCSLVPVISSIVLPILMHSESFIYTISVSIMSLIIVLVQNIIQEDKEYIPIQYNKLDYIDWIKRFVILIIYSFIFLLLKMPYFIAPPLFVLFVEFSNQNNNLKSKHNQILIIMMLASFIGLLSISMNTYLNIPLYICGIVSISLILLVEYLFKIPFPPAGAIALLPLILGGNIIFYPLEVTISSFILITISSVVFKDRTKAEDDFIDIKN